MEMIDRRTVFAAGLAASLMSNTSASAQQAAGGSAEARLREMGIELPKAMAPVANYVPAARGGKCDLPGRSTADQAGWQVRNREGRN
jgi:hypothetical protein